MMRPFWELRPVGLKQAPVHSVSIESYCSCLPMDICTGGTGAFYPSTNIAMHKMPKHHHLFLCMHLQVWAIISSKKMREHEFAIVSGKGIWSMNLNVTMDSCPTINGLHGNIIVLLSWDPILDNRQNSELLKSGLLIGLYRSQLNL